MHHTLQSSSNLHSVVPGGSTKNISRKVFNLNGSNQSSPYKQQHNALQPLAAPRPRSASAQDNAD